MNAGVEHDHPPMNTHPLLHKSSVRAALALVGLLSLGRADDANPSASHDRIEAYPGCAPDSQAFVIPLSFQSGTALDRSGDNADRFGGEMPWTSRIDAFSEQRADYTPGYPPLQVYQGFRNPLAAYGGQAGTPLHVGQTYQFGLHAGTFENLGNGLDDRAVIRIRAYPKAAFQVPAASNIAHVAEQVIPIPVPPDIATGLDDPLWRAFVSNNFSAVYEMPGLRSVLGLIDGDGPSDKWGLEYSQGCTLTHVATSDEYLYLVEARGHVIDAIFPQPMAQDGSGQPAFRSLYAMEFEQRPQWRSTYIHQPHFDAEPLPPAYQGRSPEELLRSSGPAPDFATPPDASACTSLDGTPELRQHPTLDRFVASLRSGDPARDALTFANYILNEIELTDPLSYHDDGSYETNSINAGGINRNALGVFMEQQGNPAEICSLLVYCLRSCGIPAVYAFPQPNSMRMLDSRLSRLLKMQLVGAVDYRGRSEVAGSPTTNLLSNAARDPALIAVNYPWVAAFVPDVEQGGTNRWIHIFPWLADTEITEGLDLYPQVAPVGPGDTEGIRDAWEWVDRYVRGDTNLLSIAEQNTPATIFPAYVARRLAANHPGTAIDQIGVRTRNRKNHFTRLSDLPRPFSVCAPPSHRVGLDEIPDAFDTVRIEILEDANAIIDTGEMRSADLHNRRLLIRQEKTRTGTLETEPPYGSYHYADTNLFVSSVQQQTVWCHTVKNPHSTSVKVRMDLDGADGYFDISERNDGGWGGDIEFSSLAAGATKKLYIRYRSMPDTVGHQKAKVSVDYVNKGKDYDIFCGATVNDYPDARLGLSLAPFRDSASGTNAFGGLTNPLLSRQETNAVLSLQDLPLYARITHRRHRAFNPSSPPQAFNDFLDVCASTEILQKRPLARGDLAAICLNAGRVTPRMLEAHTQEYWRMERQLDASPSLQPDPEISQGTAAYLMGMTYYERVSRFDRQLADLLKVRTLSRFAIGLSRLNAFRANGQIPEGPFTLVEPNVDMFFDIAGRAANMSLHPDSGRSANPDYENFLLLSIADISAQEHRAINTFFKQNDAVSTVRLLQLAAQSTNGIERLDRLNYAQRGDAVVAGKPLKDHDPSIWNRIKAAFADPTATGDGINSDRLADYARAYLTPGPIEAAHDGAGVAHYQGMGALILTRNRLSALISGNQKMFPQNGGFGAHIGIAWSDAGTLALDASFDGDDIAISLGQLPGASAPPQSIALDDSPSLHAIPSLLNLDYNAVVTSGAQDRFAASALAMLNLAASGVESLDYLTALELTVDLGLPGSNPSYAGNWFDRGLRALGHAVADPVNVLSGEFYIDEVDLALPGPMPVQIRRNYASHNLVPNQFGYGWKPSEFPSLGFTTNACLVYAAEMDGSVIAYRQQATNLDLFLPAPTDNPHWTNVRDGAQGGPGNIMNNRLVRSAAAGATNFTLLGADGSRREFSMRAYPIGSGNDALQRRRPYLDRWLDDAGNVLRFEYGEDPLATDYGQLLRIEGSAGNAIGFEYDARGQIIEAYAADGRRVKYEYDEHGDLTAVTRPDDSQIRYGYLHGSHSVGGRTEFFSEHLITREERPDGRVLVNAYDNQRRVTNQCATVGADLAPVRNATFQYANDFSLTNQRPISGTTTLLDAYDHPTVYRYSAGLITNIVDPLGHQIAREWFLPGDTSPGAYPRSLKSERDKRGLLTTYRYDARGNPTNIAVIGDLTGDGQPDTAVTAVFCDSNSMPVSVIGPLGHRSDTTYGDPSFPRLATRAEYRAPGGTLIRADDFQYTSVEASAEHFSRGLLARHVRAAGSPDEAIIDWGYDASGCPTAMTNHTGTADPDFVTRFRCNARGEIAESRDAAGRSTIYDYDAMGRRTWHERRDATGAPIWWTGTYYNLNGEPEWIDGPRYYPEDFIWRKYDGAGRPKEETRWRSRAKANGQGVESPSGDDVYATTFYAHDYFGNLTSMVDARGHLTAMDYDAIGQLTARRCYQGREASSGALLSQESFAREPGGLVSAHTNALGGVTLTAYTDDGKPRWMQNPDGTTLEWRYDLMGRRVRETHANGSFTECAYDDAGRSMTKTVRSPQSGTLKTESAAFDRRGNIIASIDAEGHATTRAYDGLDRTISVTGPPATGGSAQQVATLSYDAAGITNTALNALGERTITVADAIGRPTRIEIRDGAGEIVRLTRIEYAPDHQSVTTIEGSGDGAPAITNTVFSDTLGATILAVGPDGFEKCARDAGGLPVAATDRMGHTTLFSHDGLGRIESKTISENGSPRTESFGYDPLGNLVSHGLPTGLMETNAHDIAGRLVFSELVAPDGTRSERREFAYHPPANPGAGLVSTITDALGVIRSIAYDALGRPVSETASGPLPQHAFARAFTYDRRGLATEISETTSSSLTTLSRSFDPYGHIASESVTLDGETIAAFAQSWDAAGRRTRLEASAPEPFSWDFAHRPDGLLASATAASFGVEYAFSDAGLLIGRFGPSAHEVIERDPVGRLRSRRYEHAGTPFYAESGFGWNADGTLAGVETTGGPSPGEFGFDHDDRGRILRERQTGAPAFAHYDHGYDAGGLGIRIASRAFNLAPDSPAWRGDVTLANALGQSAAWSFDHDPLPIYVDGRATGAGKVGVMIRSVAFGLALVAAPWDADGYWQLPSPARLYPGAADIIATAAHPVGQYGTSATNGVDITVLAPTMTQAFDALGAVSARSWSGPSQRSQTLRRDAFGRLVAVEERDASGRGYDWTAAYDPLGRRVRTTTSPVGSPGPDGAVTTLSLYDPEIEFLEVATSVATGGVGPNHSALSWKIYGPDLNGTYGGLQGTGGLEAIVEDDAATACLHDFSGNLIGSIDPDGQPRWKSVAYSAFGPRPDATIPSLNPGVPLVDATDFRGHRREPTGLYYWGARDYDPATASFLSPDPLGLSAGPNRFAFCLNNPIAIQDPDGRFGKRAIDQAWRGDFAGADNGLAGVGGQTLTGLIPIVGQIADARDTFANIGNVWNNPTSWGAWGGLGMSVVAWAPGIGDALRGGGKVARQLDNLPSPGAWTPSGGGLPPGSGSSSPFQGLGDSTTSPWLADKRIGIESHLETFRGGGSYLVTESTLNKRILGQDTIGRRDGQFMIPADRMDTLLEHANGNLDVVKQRLGIPAAEWNEPVFRIDVHNPLLHNARLPSGLESGANDLFRWGGYTSGGLPEIVTDPIPLGGFSITPSGLAPKP